MLLNPRGAPEWAATALHELGHATGHPSRLNRDLGKKFGSATELPRQANHYAQIVGHFLEVKESKQIGKAMSAHFQRLSKYHAKLLGIANAADDEASDD